jgi:flagellar hook-associated protein 3 FlgL
MRITNNIIQRNALAALQVNARGMAAAQQRVTSGLKIERASDDPTASASIMTSQSSLRAIEQYKRNVESARSYTAAEEGALDQLSQVLDRARELATSSSSATADAGAREAARIEVEQLYTHVVQLANTQLGDRYIFGGVNYDTAPLDAAGALTAGVDPAGATQPSVQIGKQVTLRTNHHAGEVFVDSGVLQALDDLRTALGGGDLDAIAQAGDALRDGSQAVQNLLGELGVWSNQLDVTTANLDALEINLKTFKAELQEIDFEEAVTDLISRQNAYQAAMLATSRVMGMTLADYLR